MLTVMMECRDQEPELALTLSVLVAGAVEGLVSDVVVLDHGSSDGSSRVADAAGCRFYTQWDLRDVLRAARGDWLLLVEPGARPLGGWIDTIGEYVSVHTSAARLSPSRGHRRPFYQRIGRPRTPLEDGLLLPTRQAVAIAQPGMRLDQLGIGQKPRRLSCEIVPAWAARRGRD